MIKWSDILKGALFSIVSGIIAFPSLLIGLGIYGYLWENRIDPWLKKKFPKKN